MDEIVHYRQKTLNDNIYRFYLYITKISRT